MAPVSGALEAYLLVRKSVGSNPTVIIYFVSCGGSLDPF